MNLYSFYESLLKERSFVNDEINDLFLKDAFLKNNDEEKIQYLIDYCVTLKSFNLFDYICFLKKTVCLGFLLAKKDYKNIKKNKLIEKIRCNSFFDRIKLIKVLKVLIYYLFNIKDNAEINIEACFVKEYILPSEKIDYLWTKLPNSRFNCEIASILVLLSAILNKTKNCNFLNIAKKIVKWQSFFIDRDGYPMIGPWMQSCNFNENSMLHSYYLGFFSVGSYIDSSFLSYAQQLFEIIKNKVIKNEIKNIDPFYIYLMKEINEIKKYDSFNQAVFKYNLIDSSLSLISYKNEHYDACLTLSGINSGMGSLYFKDLKIMSFAPSFSLCKNTDSYGICKLPLYRFKNINNDVCYINNDNAFLCGWNKIFNFYQYENDDIFHDKYFVWQESKLKINNNKFFLDFTYLYNKYFNMNCKLKFCFYVQAKTCLIDNECVLSKGLRYEGSIKKVCLRGKYASLNILAFSSDKMHVIPLLSEEEAFFKANFLIVYEISNIHKKISFEISKI